jgi:hypothetical protein
MPAILKQRKLFTIKIFEITDKSLKVSIKKWFNYVEDEFTFEEVTTKTTRKQSINMYAFIPGLLCLVGLVITTISHFEQKKDSSSVSDMWFYFILMCVLLSIAYLTYEKMINLSLTDRRIITLYQNSPSEKEVSDFLDLLKKEQKKFLLWRYAKHDPYVSIEQLADNLSWLYDRNIINENELDQLRSKLLGKSNDAQVGFKFNQLDN